MRTTIRMDDELLRAAKRLAAETDRTLTAVIEDAVREALARRGSSQERTRVTLPTFKGNGLQPGVDLTDSAGSLALMERPDAAS